MLDTRRRRSASAAAHAALTPFVVIHPVGLSLVHLPLVGTRSA